MTEPVERQDRDATVDVGVDEVEQYETEVAGKEWENEKPAEDERN